MPPLLQRGVAATLMLHELLSHCVFFACSCYMSHFVVHRIAVRLMWYEPVCTRQDISPVYRIAPVFMLYEPGSFLMLYEVP